jgi:hypothetical protein
MPILFADDVSVLISHSNPIKFKNTINEIYGLLDDWFKKNSMSLNTIKTLYKFYCKKQRDMNILPLRSQYIYSLMIFIIKKIEKYLIQVVIAMKLILDKI